MAKLLKTNLKPVKVGVKEYSSPFSLLPPNETPPTIVRQPIDMVQQTTWISRYEQSTPIFQAIQPKQNRVVMLQGTAFSLEALASDPSNADVLNQPSKLSYKWKRDESLLVDFSKGVGKTKLTINRPECVPSKSGMYVCEVTNQYGTTSTTAVSVEIIDPDNHPKLYKNLIVNGDGSGGTDGWEVQGGIRSEAFQEHLAFAKNFASFQLGGLITFKKDREEANLLPPKFRFSNGSHYGLFFPWYLKRYKEDSTFRDINVQSPASRVLNNDESYISEGILPQILPNEDYGAPNAKVAGFFPGPLWMDKYNKNSNPEQINLNTEIHQKNLTYLTRDKLRFVNTGGTTQASLSQTVDVSDLADAIDGNAYGIKYLTSQFFAYVGTGITGYQIKARVRKETTEPFVEKTFNYYIGDSEAYKKMFAQDAYKNIKTEYAEGPNGPYISYEDLAKTYNPNTLGLDAIEKADQYAQTVPKLQKELEDLVAEQAQLETDIPIVTEELKDLHKENNRRLTALIAGATVLVGALAYMMVVLAPVILGLGGLVSTMSAATGFISFTAAAATATVASTFVGGLAALAVPVTRYIGYKRDESLKELDKLLKEERLSLLRDALIPAKQAEVAQATTELDALDKKKWLVLVEQQAFFQAQIERSYLLEDKSNIEITPITSDTTEIVLEYLDRNGSSLKEERIKGPSSLDIWAVKEKVFFPLTLHPLFTFLRPSSFDANVTIRVLGQKYTTTNVLRPFFTREEIGRGTGLLSQGIKSLKDDATFSTLNSYEFPTPVQDKNALFLLRKYNFAQWGAAYPPDNEDYALPNSVRKYTTQNAVLDQGAAAMFGVGRNVILPTRTRSIRVKVIFSHNSSILEDVTANLKGWSDSEIYSDVYGQTSGTSQRLIEYGNPRCGITAIKLLLAVNDIAVDDKHVTYSIPPASSTALGLLYNRYKDPNAFNSADIPTFDYKIYQPQTLQEAPVISNPFAVNSTPPTPPQSLTSDSIRALKNNTTIAG